jgi:hypothetical protein
MATKIYIQNEVGRKWDVGSGTRPTQKQLKKKKKKNSSHSVVPFKIKLVTKEAKNEDTVLSSLLCYLPVLKCKVKFT